MITIYVDVLICVNFFVNYFILLCVKKFLSLNTKNSRLIICAGVTSLFSLLIFLPPLASIFSFLLKVLCSVVTVFITFGYKNRRSFIRQLAVFLLTNIGFCGIILLISGISINKISVVNNDWIYINMSPVVFIILTLICYLIFRFIQIVTKHKTEKDIIHKIKVKKSGCFWEFFGKTDTGCSLYEPFSGSPVIIADPEVFQKKQSSAAFITGEKNNFEDENKKENSPAFRVIPFETLLGEGFLKAFKADEVYIDGKKSDKEIYIAISEGKIKDKDTAMALLNHDIVE